MFVNKEDSDTKHWKDNLLGSDVVNDFSVGITSFSDWPEISGLEGLKDTSSALLLKSTIMTRPI